MTHKTHPLLVFFLLISILLQFDRALHAQDATPKHTVQIKVIDIDTGSYIPARIYIRDSEGGWHHVLSSDRKGSAVRYEKRNWVNKRSEEFHTTVSAHPFVAELTPGRYELTVERGKEYFPTAKTFTVVDKPLSLVLPMKRWINMAQRAWYSGDTHVHRSLQELPNIMLAEDLNVSFPLTYWVTHILLNCGLNMVPTGGTANGVHPVPLGFGRVYVYLPVGFSYEAWKQGLKAGRSFVTTGPMLLVTVNGRPPGERFTVTKNSFQARIQAGIISERPISFTEVIQNGQAVRTIMGRAKRTDVGAYRMTFDAEVTLAESGWLAIRCWEDRDRDRLRYAHSAPWHVSIGGEPVKARAEERDYLIERVKREIARSQDILPMEAIQEYREALSF